MLLPHAPDRLWPGRSPWAQLAQRLPFDTAPKKARTLLATLQRFWDRQQSDDLLFLFLVAIDAQLRPVSSPPPT